MNAGLICTACQGGRCSDEPSELEAFYPPGLSCPSCGGEGCPACRYSGKARVTTCPRKLVGRGERELLDSAEDGRRGFLPVAGGSMDQAAGAMAAIRFVWRYEEAIGKK